MIDTVCATKKGMSQTWDARGKRLAITKFFVEPNVVVGAVVAKVKTDKKDATAVADQRVVEIGYGAKKLKRMSKPMRTRLDKLSLKNGVKHVIGIREIATGEALTLGQVVPTSEILKVGSIVQVQGETKGRGFAGGMKRYHFHGGPKTHGQSDRARAVGSVGNRTTPGRVWPGKRLPGHYGVETKTIAGLTVIRFDEATSELWLSGPVPGAFNSLVIIKNTGKMNKKLQLVDDSKPTSSKPKSADTKDQDSAPKAESSTKEESKDNTAKEQQ